MDCGLLERVPCSPSGCSRWAWTNASAPEGRAEQGARAPTEGARAPTEGARAPTESALAACGFAGSSWIDPPHPSGHGASNLLLLLHGLGDQPAPFASLARKLALPQTASLALRAPHPLPAAIQGSCQGTCWMESFEENGELISASAGHARRLRSLERECIPRLCELITTLARYGWPAHRCYLFGYSQGGTGACATHKKRLRLRLDESS